MEIVMRSHRRKKVNKIVRPMRDATDATIETSRATYATCTNLHTARVSLQTFHHNGSNLRPHTTGNL